MKLNLSFFTPIALTMVTVLNIANAQKAHKNPFTLVYEGAIAENVDGKVNIHPVTYTIKDITIAANVYTPPNYNHAQKYPAIVIAHPNGGVKEQVAGLYAQRLAEQGYITITADAAYQGGSGGTPRNVDKPANRIEDIYAMGDFIAQYKGVDTAKLGLLGICGGGGYSLKAAQADKRFKAIATISMFNSGVVRRNGFMNSQYSTIQERLEQASNARAIEAAGGEVLYAATAEWSDEMADKMPFDLYREGHYYYNRTHAHPNSTFRYTMSSLIDLMTWDASTNMDLINQPLLMIAGSKADTYYMTDNTFSKATNAKRKELFLINGATHIETYWKPEYVSQAVNKLVSFYQANLFSKTTEQEIIDLSKQKWQWMADKNADVLDELFHEKSMFVHMGGSWGKEQELDIIKSGGIHYKKTDIHEVSVNIMGNTAILLNKITLLAVVGGNEVTNPFMVTEVYLKEGEKWVLGSLSFTKLLNP
ncbi:MAG: DUF4440 domain-containing protein [Saprospiraceae bacterium]|nr:DUF4440 domain-containing protein [Saprospiraceae bacterium]